MTRLRPAAWLMAAVALFLLAVAGYALLVHVTPQYYWRQIDTGVYRNGSIAVRTQSAMPSPLTRLRTTGHGRDSISGLQKLTRSG